MSTSPGVRAAGGLRRKKVLLANVNLAATGNSLFTDTFGSTSFNSPNQLAQMGYPLPPANNTAIDGQTTTQMLTAPRLAAVAATQVGGKYNILFAWEIGNDVTALIAGGMTEAMAIAQAKINWSDLIAAYFTQGWNDVVSVNLLYRPSISDAGVDDINAWLDANFAGRVVHMNDQAETYARIAPQVTIYRTNTTHPNDGGKGIEASRMARFLRTKYGFPNTLLQLPYVFEILDPRNLASLVKAGGGTPADGDLVESGGEATLVDNLRMTQTDPTVQPTYRTSGAPGGKPSLEFNNGPYMASSDTAGTVRTPVTEFGFTHVLRAVCGLSPSVPIDFNTDSDADYIYTAPGSPQNIYQNRGGVLSEKTVDDTTFGTDGSMHLYSHRQILGTHATHLLDLDGAPTALTDGAVGDPGGPLTTAVLFLGARALTTGPILPMQGFVDFMLHAGVGFTDYELDEMDVILASRP